MKANFLKSLSVISPFSGAVSRKLKYHLAFLWKVSSSLVRRLMGSNSASNEELQTINDFNVLLVGKEKYKNNKQNSNPKVLLLGPYHFNQPMWSVRASSAIPDLIEPIKNIAEVHFVTPIPNLETSKSLNVLVENLGIYHHLLPPNFNLRNLREKADVLDDLVAAIKPDIIMNSFGVIASGFDCVTCAKRNDIPSILRIPGNELLAHEKMSDGKNLSGKDISQAKMNSSKADFAVMNADEVIVMSKAEAARIAEIRRLKKGISVQIRGIDTNLFKPESRAEEQSIKDERAPLNIGFVGRLSKEKGTDILLEVLNRLRVNSNVLFHIASPESLEVNIKPQTSNLRSHGYVGHHAMPDFMSKLDLLILPSHTEGLSQTMMEAMSSGLPVLLQKHIHPEQLPGMVHCNADAATFVEAIEIFEQDREKLAEFAKAARNTAVKNFDKTTWSIKMTELFQEVLRAN